MPIFPKNPIRELIRKDADRLRLRDLLLAGAASASTKPANVAYFEMLKKRIRQYAQG